MCPSTSSSEKNGVLGHEVDACHGSLQQPGQRRCGVVHGRSLLAAEAPPHLGGQLAEQGLLVLEVPVEEALGDTRGVDDVDDTRRRVALLGEEAGGCVEQLLLALGALGRELAVGHRERQCCQP